MSLYVSTVALDGFRNHQGLHLQLKPAINIIVGDNAIGKTNVIEALVYLTRGESFRAGNFSEAIPWGEEKSRISLKALGDGRELELSCQLGEKKELKVNGKPKQISKYKGIYPSVLFIPDDLSMIKGSASSRRQTLDNVGTQLSYSYYKIKKDYEKVVAQRNNLLKDETISQEYFATWTTSLYSLGLLFFKHRNNLFSSIKQEFETIYSHLNSQNNAVVEYIPSWDNYIEITNITNNEEAFQKALDIVSVRERQRGISLIGPHRDEILFTIDGMDARHYGSQGQQRLLTLTWKLAELQVIETISGKKPLLLLDDVMSEFDDNRRQALMCYIGQHYQTVITTTTLDYFSEEILKDANIITFKGKV